MKLTTRQNFLLIFIGNTKIQEKYNFYIKSEPFKMSLSKFIPPTRTAQRYYTKTQVSQHNTANDCWIVLFGQVYDLTNLIQSNITLKQTRPLIESAGTDITYWFDSVSREPRIKINPYTAQQQFYCPKGQYLHLHVENQIKWWKNQEFIIGKLSKKSRKIQLYNMITDHINILEVPEEETINQILARYKKFNKHGGSYIWKRLGRPLDMEKTLQENGIPDQDNQFQQLEIQAKQWYVPTIHLFFSDDLTVA